MFSFDSINRLSEKFEYKFSTKLNSDKKTEVLISNLNLLNQEQTDILELTANYSDVYNPLRWHSPPYP